MNISKENKFEWIYGTHAVQAFLTNRFQYINKIVFAKKFINSSIIKDAKSKGVSINLVDDAFFRNFPPGNQGIGCLCNPDTVRNDFKEYLKTIDERAIIVILDSVTDPQNFASCIRSSLSFGASCLIIPKHQSATVTPIVHKISVGGASSLPIFKVVNICQTLEIF